MQTYTLNSFVIPYIHALCQYVIAVVGIDLVMLNRSRTNRAPTLRSHMFCSGKQFSSSSFSGCNGLVVEYRTCNQEVAGLTHTRYTASNLEQLANLYCVLRPTQPPILSGTGKE